MPQGNKPLFSIIVPIYNVEEYLPQCIESVLKQNLQDYELILIDDGSTDSSSKICEQYSKKYSSIKLIHQSNAGLSAARNTGVAAASGEYLIFLDGDDYLEPSALEAISNALEPGLDLLRYQAQEVFDDNRVIRHEETGFATTTGIKAFPKLAHYHYTENAWLYAYRREFFAKNQFQYAKGCIAEDFGLTPVIIAHADTTKAIPNICYNYRQRDGSIMHDTTKISRRIRDIEQQFQTAIPNIAAVPHSEPILHYLIVSFLTDATTLSRSDFLGIYQSAKKSGMLRYIHPSSLRAIPRALLLRYFPSIFYLVYRH